LRVHIVDIEIRVPNADTFYRYSNRIFSLDPRYILATILYSPSAFSKIAPRYMCPEESSLNMPSIVQAEIKTDYDLLGLRPFLAILIPSKFFPTGFRFLAAGASDE